ncbi:MAG: hypothetical protein H3C48_15895 [Chitinophagaceae bacterium]|nr:hypothetical protein [Chitinophagaceae bacterium]
MPEVRRSLHAEAACPVGRQAARSEAPTRHCEVYTRVKNSEGLFTPWPACPVGRQSPCSGARS